MSRPSWQDHARCLNYGFDPFYADDARHAKAFCGLCPVWQACLQQGFNELHGTWGGLTRSERARLRRLRSRSVADPNDPQNPVDARRLLSAGMTPERLSIATGIAAGTIAAWAEARRQRRRGQRVSSTRSL